MHVPGINWDKVRQRVTEFNSSGAPFYLAEVALHEAFKHGLTAEAVPLCVMAVNSFWNANVDKEPGALKDLCERTIAELANINDQLASVRAVALPNDAAGIAVIVSGTRKLLPRFLKASDGKRTNYSFASKFLHWCCPSSFPIVDNLSVRTINSLVGAGTIWVPNSNTATTEERCIQSYEHVIDFYNQVLGQLEDREQVALVDFDFVSQPLGLRKRNTPVRILDKWMWMEQKQAQR